MRLLNNCSCSICTGRKISHFVLGLAVLVLGMLLFSAMPGFASTGSVGEITNIHLENVTQTTIDVVWDTVHPSTSQVIIARDTNYDAERWMPAVPDPNLVNHHRVTVTNLVPYYSVTGDGTYYYYVASIDVNNNLYTNPGPSDPSGNTNPPPYLKMQTLPTNTAGAINYSVSAWGPTNVFAGSDMWIQIRNILVAGPISHLYIINSGTKDQLHDGVVKDGNNNVVTSISVHYACRNYDPNGNDSSDQVVGTPYNYCWGSVALGANNDVLNHMIRLRTSATTPPGAYTLTFTVSPDGTLQNAASYTYSFNVQPAATFTATPPNTFPPIPNQSMWETQMTTLGGYWCDGTNGNSRDSENKIGNFLTGFGWYADAWNYDGGRVYQQIEDYTAAHGQADHPRWQHCALTILDPYRQFILANNASLQGPAIFPYGMAMNYWRTGDNTNYNAVNYLATNDPFHGYGGYVDYWWVRETAYQLDVWVAAEMLGHARYPLATRAVDRLLGHMDQLVNQTVEMHPFMAGLAMEALINWYELTVLENNPDYRVPVAIKQVLDALWKTWWIPSNNSLLYSYYNIPNINNFPELNDLVAPAYAWYWSQTGDNTYLTEGDLMFQHTFDSPNYAWSGKQFSQIYKWSFDYVNWRSGALTTSTVAQANNPYSGPYADTEPPIEFSVAAQNITTSSASITWNTYELADSQVYYGLTKQYGSQSQLIDTGGNGKTSHVISLTGLTSRTTYHFQVRSHDAANNLAASADFTFTTH
jgi:hypothetical protein